MGLGGPGGTGGDLFQIAFQAGQAVELLQAQGSGRGCIFGPRAEAIPAPQVALSADKALAGLQRVLQMRAFLAQDQTDLAHAARHDFGCLHMIGQRFDASGKGLRFGIIGQRDPTRTPVDRHLRRAQIIGKRGTDGLFQPRLDDQQIEMPIAVDIAGTGDAATAVVGSALAIDDKAARALADGRQLNGLARALAKHHIAAAGVGAHGRTWVAQVGADDQVGQTVAVDVAGRAHAASAVVGGNLPIDHKAIGTAACCHRRQVDTRA